MILSATAVNAGEDPRELIDLLRRDIAGEPEKQRAATQLLAARAAVLCPEPSKWDAAVYLPYAVPNDLLSKISGSKVAADIAGLATVTLTLKAARVIGDWGEAKVELEVEAGTSLNADTAGLVVSGRLLYQGFAENREGTTSAVFAVALDAPKATANVSGQTFRAPEWVGNLIANGAMRLLEEQLRFAVPVPLQFSRKFGYTGESLLRTGEGWIKLNVSAPGTTLRQEITEIAPIFVPSGVWLGVDFEEGLPAGANTPAAPAPTMAPPTLASLQAALAPYEKQGGTMPRLFVNGQYLASLVNGIGQLALAERTAAVTIAEHGGNLAKTGGDVYAKAYLQNNDGGGSLTVAPSAIWGPEGLKITCGYEAAARANMHIHVDPGPSGGVGTSVGIRGGTGQQKVTGTLGLRLLQNPKESQPGTVLALKAIFTNQAVTLTAKTDGRFKLKLLGGWMSASVPEIGAKITIPVPHNVVPTIPLLSDAPLGLEFAEPVDLPAGGVLTPPEKGLPSHMLIAAGEPEMDGIGCVVPFAVSFVTLSKEDALKRRQAVEAVLNAENRPTIEIGVVEVDLGGIKIGKNNDIIKAIMNTVDTATKAGKDVAREADRAADNVEREVGKAGGNVEREVGRAGKNVEREVGKLSKNVERTVADAAKDVGKTVDKASKDTQREIRKFFKRLF